jgi:hypothetical protein
LEHLFETRQVSSLLQSNFHVVTIDVGFYPDADKQKNDDVAVRYGVGLMKSSIPAIVVLNAAGKTIASTREGQWRTARNFSTNDILAYLEGVRLRSASILALMAAVLFLTRGAAGAQTSSAVHVGSSLKAPQNQRREAGLSADGACFACAGYRHP